MTASHFPQRAHMASIKVQGHDIVFPVGKVPFGPQLALMNGMITALTQRENALLESPTGMACLNFVVAAQCCTPRLLNVSLSYERCVLVGPIFCTRHGQDPCAARGSPHVAARVHEAVRQRRRRVAQRCAASSRAGCCAPRAHWHNVGVCSKGSRVAGPNLRLRRRRRCCRCLHATGRTPTTEPGA